MRSEWEQVPANASVGSQLAAHREAEIYWSTKNDPDNSKVSWTPDLRNILLGLIIKYDIDCLVITFMMKSSFYSSVNMYVYYVSHLILVSLNICFRVTLDWHCDVVTRGDMEYFSFPENLHKSSSVSVNNEEIFPVVPSEMRPSVEKKEWPAVWCLSMGNVVFFFWCRVQ